ncbi:MAG: hypothetical protein ACJAS4_001383 [Bacteriovoracaceae bacterium]|jgi:hypothetical protein
MKISLFLILFLSSCAGYRFQKKSNPFSQYGIRSISVPMFYNHSNHSDVSGVFTKEIFNTLTEFKDLKITSGNSNSDAVLIGIVSTPQRLKDSIKSVGSKSVINTHGKNIIGDQRDDFFVTSVNRLDIYLRVIVIKHPTKEEIKFLQTEMGQNVVNSRIIFNERISIRESYNLKELQGEATKVLGTQNRGLKKSSILNLAKTAAGNFKDMILYAF